MTTNAITTTVQVKGTAAPEKTEFFAGIKSAIKSIFNRNASTPAPLTPERVNPVLLINNQINSGDVNEIIKAVISLSDLPNSETLKVQAKEKLISAILDIKHSPVEAARLTLNAFRIGFFNKEEVEKIAVKLGMRAVEELMAADLPLEASYELCKVLNIFRSVFSRQEDIQLFDKVLDIDDLITATVNDLVLENEPFVITNKILESVEDYSRLLALPKHQSYFYEQVTRRLKAAEKFESNKVEVARLANEKAMAADAARAERLAKDVAEAQAKAKSKIESIMREAAQKHEARICSENDKHLKGLEQRIESLEANFNEKDVKDIRGAMDVYEAFKKTYGLYDAREAAIQARLGKVLAISRNILFLRNGFK